MGFGEQPIVLYNLISIKSITDILRLGKSKKIGIYPMYAFILYDNSEDHKALADFVRINGNLLHELSGDDCLIGVFEDTVEWGDDWKKFWSDRLGSEFEKVSSEWLKFVPFDRNKVYNILRYFGLELNEIPCVVIIEDLKSKNYVYLPIIVDVKDYHRYFLDVFTAVSSANKAPSGKRLESFRDYWASYWVKWILPKKIEKMEVTLKKAGSIIKEVKDTAIIAVEPISPIANCIIGTIKK